MVLADYRNEVRWWRKNTWNGVVVVLEVLARKLKNEGKRNNWIAFRVSKSYNQYKICWHIRTKKGLSHLSLLLTILTREGRGIPSTRSWAEHISLIRDSVKCFWNLWQLFFALFSMHELPATNQSNGNGTILGIVCNTFWKELWMELHYSFTAHWFWVISYFFFSKTKTSIDLKMAKQPAKHVEPYNISRDWDYKISKPFDSRDQGKRPWHYRRWCIPLQSN